MYIPLEYIFYIFLLIEYFQYSGETSNYSKSKVRLLLPSFLWQQNYFKLFPCYVSGLYSMNSICDKDRIFVPPEVHFIAIQAAMSHNQNDNSLPETNTKQKTPEK